MFLPFPGLLTELLTNMGLELFKTPLASDANLKAYYRLEADGTDSSGNGKTLTSGGSPTYGAGVFGSGVTFPTETDLLSIVDDLGVQGGACSISFWVKLASDIASGSFNFCQQNDAGTLVGNCVSYEYNAGTRRLFFRRSKWNVAHQGPTYNVALGTGWNHIVYTYDGTNVRGYLNGVLVAGPTAASGNGSGVLPDSFQIVGAANAVAGDVSKDDVAFFNRALTAGEVLSLYQGDGWTASTNTLTNYRPRKRTPGVVSV